MIRSDDMRVGDAERDAVALALHDHFAAGRIDREELDERLDGALAAKTDGDLRAVVRDLPGHNGLTVPDAPAPARTAAARDLPFGPSPWFHGHGHGLGHPRGHRHPHMRGRPHPAMRHGHAPFAKFPLLVGLFAFVAIAAGPGAAVLAVLQVAMLIWIVRAVLLAVSVRRARRSP